MTTHHLDTNVVADVGRGSHLLVTRRFEQIDKNRIAISVIVLGELRVGTEKAGNVEEGLKLSSLLSPVAVVGVDANIAYEYARLRAQLESIGQKMDGNDLWIAATALAKGAILVTADEAFTRVPGLKTENWRV